MKKVLFFVLSIAFSTAVSAQTMPSVSSDDVKKAGVEALSEQNPELENQIKEALMKDEGLQKETLSYLKKNPDTTDMLAGLIGDNSGSTSNLIKAVLDNKDLTTAAIDWISKNPEMLSKVMKIVGM